jgi:hypothetical protein
VEGTRIPALGPRGEGWVAAQLVVGGLVAVLGFLGPGWPDPVRFAASVAGAVLLAAYPEYAAYRERVRWRLIPGVR